MDLYESEGWTKNVGERPVSMETKVDVMFEGSGHCVENYCAHNWGWDLDGEGCDIHYWRVHKATLETAYDHLNTPVTFFNTDNGNTFTYPKTNYKPPVVKPDKYQFCADLYNKLFKKEMSAGDIQAIETILEACALQQK